MHYYQHHIGDFIKATARLTDSQVMAYLRLIWHYYDHDGIVKNDPVQISFEIGSDVELIKQIIKTFFDVDGDFLKHSRCDKEIEGYKNKSAGGKKGAQSRWGNNKKDSLPIANPLPTQSDLNATPILTNNQEPITNIVNKKTKTSKTSLPENFEISDRVKTWAQKNNISSIGKHFDNFVLQAKKQGYKYADWDSAFMVAIRDNWAKIEKKAWE